MLYEKLKNYKLILASNSPRREYLLKEAGFQFELRTPSESSEDYPDDMQACDIPIYLARKKASLFNGVLSNTEIVITADTIVILEDRILGKPKDFNEAYSMLSSLSGCRHDVITAVCLKSKEREYCFSARSEVWFKALSEEEIIQYINNYKPYDKAGAYGAQEWIGYIGIERINGSFFNVMGLPIQMLYVELEKFIEFLA
jgi:septum formation protein